MRSRIPHPLLPALLLLVLLPAASSAWMDLFVTQPHATADFGERERGAVFSDTLGFYYRPQMADSTIVLRIEDAEVTCDCITSALLDDGRMAFTYHVEPEEPDGLVEKVIYLFTDHPEMDVIRLVLTITVPPGGEEAGEGEGETGERSASGSSAAVTESPDALRVLYFYSPGCPSCREVQETLLPELRERWGDRIRIEEIDIDETRGYGRLLAAREHYGVEDKRSPFSFFIGESVVLGRGDLGRRINQAIQQALNRGEETFRLQPEDLPDVSERARSVFQSFTFWTVIGAGLLDGVNPCAFATIVFFISLLNYAGSTRKQVLAVGLGFTISVFAVYLLLGLGAFHTLELLGRNTLAQRIIYGAAFLMVAVLFVLSVIDTVRYYASGGKTQGQLLQLSTKNKQRIHKVMRRGLVTGSLFLGALGIGALVSLFEAACTGQVYLPTIVLVMQDEAMRGDAVLYLVLYNLMFIAPLVAVFVLAYLGVASDTLGQWSKRHFGVTRIALSALFLLLAVLMATMVW